MNEVNEAFNAFKNIFQNMISTLGISGGEVILIIVMLYILILTALDRSTALKSQKVFAKNIKMMTNYVHGMEAGLRALVKDEIIPQLEIHNDRLHTDIKTTVSKIETAMDGDTGINDIIAPLARQADAHLNQAKEHRDEIGTRIAQSAATQMNRIETRIESVSELVKSGTHKGITDDTGALRDIQAAAEQMSRIETRIESIAELVNKSGTRESAADDTGDTGALRDKMEQQAIYLHDEFAALTAKIDRLATNADAPNAPNTDNRLLEMLTQSMHRLSSEMDTKLSLLNGKLEKSMETRWSDALVSLTSLRGRIEELVGDGERIETQRASPLTHIMLAAPAHEGEGEDDSRMLSEILPQILPLEHFTLDTELPSGHRAEVLVKFPDPHDSIVIDAGFSPPQIGANEESRRAFSEALLTRINHIADNLIAPPHTSEHALLYISSDATFAEIHSRHRDAVKTAQTRRVWLVSPSTLPAVINTVNTAIRDHDAQRRLKELRKTVAQIVEEARHFEHRLTEIGDHVNSAWRSVQRAENAGERLLGGIRDMSRDSREAETSIVPVKNDSDSA